MALKTNNVIPLRTDNQLLNDCRARIARKMRRLGIYLVKTTKRESLPFKPFVTIEPDPLTKENLERIQKNKREATDRIKRNPDINPIATNINVEKMPRRKGQFTTPPTFTDDAA